MFRGKVPVSRAQGAGVACSDRHSFSVDTAHGSHDLRIRVAMPRSAGNMCRSGQVGSRRGWPGTGGWAGRVAAWLAARVAEGMGDRARLAGCLRSEVAGSSGNVTEGDGFGTVWTGVEPSP